jgi:hypothetical protein
MLMVVGRVYFRDEGFWKRFGEVQNLVYMSQSLSQWLVSTRLPHPCA